MELYLSLKTFCVINVSEFKRKSAVQFAILTFTAFKEKKEDDLTQSYDKSPYTNRK